MSCLKDRKELVLISGESRRVGVLKLHSERNDFEGNEWKLDLSLKVGEELQVEVGFNVRENWEANGVLDPSGSGVGISLVVSLIAYLEIVGIIELNDIRDLKKRSRCELIGVGLDKFVSKGWRGKKSGCKNSLKHLEEVYLLL